MKIDTDKYSTLTTAIAIDTGEVVRVETVNLRNLGNIGNNRADIKKALMYINKVTYKEGLLSVDVNAVYNTTKDITLWKEPDV